MILNGEMYLVGHVISKTIQAEYAEKFRCEMVAPLFVRNGVLLLIQTH